MSRHNNLVIINLSFFVALESCRDKYFFLSTMSRYSLLCCDIRYGFLIYLFVLTIFSFFEIEFLTIVC